MTIDLGPAGKAGVEARVYQRTDGYVVYVLGTDHWRDWLHHFLPGAKRREWRAADEIVAALVGMGLAVQHEPDEQAYLDELLFVSGHSWGACIAAMVAAILAKPAYVYGGKRAPRKGTVRYYVAAAFRHRGDFVPFLPPWRPRYKHQTTFGKWLPVWEAHQISNYREVMR